MAKLSNNERSPFTDVVKLTWEDLKEIGNGGLLKSRQVVVSLFALSPTLLTLLARPVL